MGRTRNGKPEAPATKKKQTTTRRTKQATTTARPPKNDEAGTTAKARGERTRLSMVERIRLAQRLVAARSKPRPDGWTAIAKREAIPVRTLQHILMEYERDMALLGDATGMPVLSETLLLYTQAIARLAHEAEYGETGAVRVGAIRQMLDALKGRVELLAVMGRMPRSFRALDELAMLQRLVRRLADVAEKHQLPPEVIHEFISIADEIQPVIEGTGVVTQLPMAS